jgi:ABC-type lipoprotein release transport system permease subunit
LASFALTRYLSHFLFGVSPHDLETFLLIPMVLYGVALLACYVPARRAMRADPLAALRYE